uniref:Uncharacterized protein n=1 Tax=Anguilla anguilla TaxID=7936 RepID=A0A0E9SPW9_ANGAN
MYGKDQKHRPEIFECTESSLKVHC